jgi:hypothetical protein
LPPFGCQENLQILEMVLITLIIFCNKRWTLLGFAPLGMKSAAHGLTGMLPRSLPMETLQQRINNYLREHAPLRYVEVVESSRTEYDLQRAEIELRAAQERVDRLRRKLAKAQHN